MGKTFPQGCLRKIRSIDDLQSNYESLLYYYEFNLKKYKLTKQISADDIIQNSSNYIEYKQTVISDNPENCTDIDDALGLEYLSNDTLLVVLYCRCFIYIEFINEPSLWNQSNRNQQQFIYQIKNIICYLIISR